MATIRSEAVATRLPNLTETTATRPVALAAVEGARPDLGRAMSLHVSKLRGISVETRAKLKRQGVTYTHQLLLAAGHLADRVQFVARSNIDEGNLSRLVHRADLARVKGVGAIFADMLEVLEVDTVARLAAQEPEALHRRLYELNSVERFARRAPTPEEVQDWVSQARSLPLLLDDD